MTQLSLITDQAPAVDPQPRAIVPWRMIGPFATLYHGSCIDVMRAMPARSVDAIATDPPYGIGFMGKQWDTFNLDTVRENERKAFKADHGFNVDDPRRTNPNLKGRERSPAMSPSQIEYDRSLEGQRGFQAWCEEWATEAIRVLKPGAHMVVCGAPRSQHRMVSGVEDAGFEIRDALSWLFAQGFPKSLNLDEELEGLGTALKPGHETICLARKPLKMSIEDNVREWGVGALSIDTCRLDKERWPANVALDEEAAAILDAQAGVRSSSAPPKRRRGSKPHDIFQRFSADDLCVPARGANSGGPSRFYFVAKPSRAERDYGCDNLPLKLAGELTNRKEGSAGLNSPRAGAGRTSGGRNSHPTVKPVSLMQWLLWLIAPPGGIVLDPFLGSGTTGMAAIADGYTFIGIEAEPLKPEDSFEYLETAASRIGQALTDRIGATC